MADEPAETETERKEKHAPCCSDPCARAWVRACLHLHHTGSGTSANSSFSSSTTTSPRSWCGSERATLVVVSLVVRGGREEEETRRERWRSQRRRARPPINRAPGHWAPARDMRGGAARPRPGRAGCRGEDGEACGEVAASVFFSFGN
jgi:hypothetical protein